MNLTQRNEFLECLKSIANFSHASLQQQQQQPRLSDEEHLHVHKHEHEHEHEHEDEDEGLLVAKITAVFVLFLASSFCGSLPFLVQYFFNWPNNEKKNIDAQSTTIVKCLLYFGGGVLLCTTFVHLLPEVQETVEQLTECQLLPQLKFPLAQLLMCIGFFLMYLVEETIHTYIHYQQVSHSFLHLLLSTYISNKTEMYITTGPISMFQILSVLFVHVLEKMRKK